MYMNHVWLHKDLDNEDCEDHYDTCIASISTTEFKYAAFGMVWDGEEELDAVCRYAGLKVTVWHKTAI